MREALRVLRQVSVNSTAALEHGVWLLRVDLRPSLTGQKRTFCAFLNLRMQH